VRFKKLHCSCRGPFFTLWSSPRNNFSPAHQFLTQAGVVLSNPDSSAFTDFRSASVVSTQIFRQCSGTTLANWRIACDTAKCRFPESSSVTSWWNTHEQALEGYYLPRPEPASLNANNQTCAYWLRESGRHFPRGSWFINGRVVRLTVLSPNTFPSRGCLVRSICAFSIPRISRIWLSSRFADCLLILVSIDSPGVYRLNRLGFLHPLR
jgi:hypothetical protein